MAAPQASFDGKYLMDHFEIAAAYVTSLFTHHPFLDANKRTAAGGALVFLSINGFIVNESRDEELARGYYQSGSDPFKDSEILVAAD